MSVCLSVGTVALTLIDTRQHIGQPMLARKILTLSKSLFIQGKGHIALQNPI